jgi:hypothetical protein
LPASGFFVPASTVFPANRLWSIGWTVSALGGWAVFAVALMVTWDSGSTGLPAPVAAAA